MAETTAPTFLVELPKHVPGWDSRARSSREGRAVAISGPRKQRGATLRGCELSAEEGCLFEGEKDALVFYPPLELASVATIAVELKPRTLTRDERWLVATFGKGVKGESAHICLLQTEGQQLLGLWDGDQEQWHACEPECDIAPKGDRFVRIVAQIEQSQTSYYVDGVLVGCAAHAVHAPILGAGNVPLCDRPKSSSRKQVVGWMKRLEVYSGLVYPQHCFPTSYSKPKPAIMAPCSPDQYETGAPVQQPPPRAKVRRVTDDAGPKKKKPKKKAVVVAEPPPPPPRSLDPAQRVCASRVLAVHGEEEAFLEAVRAAPRGRHLWLGYDPKPPVDGKSLDAFLRARPHRTVFKFRGEDAPSFGLGALGAELEHAARQNGGAAAMQILRDKSQMSTLFAPTGAGDTDWNHAKTSIEVSFDGFIRSADRADTCRSRRDVKGLDREVEKGSNAQKVTEWKPAFLRRSGTTPDNTGLLPPWFESRSWLTKLKRSDAEVFRPKFALMQAGACTEHHRDNYGTLTWIKVLGGSQLLATWNMADGDSTPELSDNQEEHDEDFPWSTFAQLPSARLVFLDVGDVFFMRPGVYHRVFTLSAKVQLFGEFVGASTFVESLKSAKADRERPHCLKACDSRITMTSLFLAGLAAELGEVDDGPLKAALALGGLEALRAIRTLPDKYLDRCSRCLGFDADAACQQLLACPGL